MSSSGQEKKNSTSNQDFWFIFGSVMLGFLICSFILIIVGLVVYKQSVVPMMTVLAAQQKNANIVASQQTQILREISRFMQQQQRQIQDFGAKRPQVQQTPQVPQAPQTQQTQQAGGPGYFDALGNFVKRVAAAPGNAYRAAQDAGYKAVQDYGGAATVTPTAIGIHGNQPIPSNLGPGQGPFGNGTLKPTVPPRQ